MSSIKELTPLLFWKVWVSDWDDLDETEKGMIQEYLEEVARVTMSNPAFVLEIIEQNLTKSKVTMKIKAARTDENGVCTLGSSCKPNTLFETTSTQLYKATHQYHHELDYVGEITVKVTMGGVWDKKLERDVPCKEADTIAMLVYGLYYRLILKHYPEWMTDYRDAPNSKTAVVEHL